MALYPIVFTFLIVFLMVNTKITSISKNIYINNKYKNNYESFLNEFSIKVIGLLLVGLLINVVPFIKQNKMLTYHFKHS